MHSRCLARNNHGRVFLPRLGQSVAIPKTPEQEVAVMIPIGCCSPVIIIMVLFIIGGVLLGVEVMMNSTRSSESEGKQVHWLVVVVVVVVGLLFHHRVVDDTLNEIHPPPFVSSFLCCSLQTNGRPPADVSLVEFAHGIFFPRMGRDDSCGSD